MRKVFLLGLFAFALILMSGFASAVIESTGFSPGGTDPGQSAFKGVSYFVGGKDVLLQNITKDNSTGSNGLLQVRHYTSGGAGADTELILANFSIVSGNVTGVGSYTLLKNTEYWIGFKPNSTTNEAFQNGKSYNVTGVSGNFTGATDGSTKSTNNMFIIVNISVVEAASLASATITVPTNNTGFMSATGQTINATAVPTSTTDTAVNATVFFYNSATGAFIGKNFTTFVPANKTNFSMPNIEGSFRIDVQFCGSKNDCIYAAPNVTYSVDSIAPVNVSITVPKNGSYLYSINSSVTQFNLNISGVDANTAFCYYNSSYNSTLTPAVCNGIIQVNLTNIFGLQTLFGFFNDTVGNTVMNSSIILIHRSFLSSPVYETQTGTFILELWNQSTAPTNAVLNYSNTNHSASVASLAPLGSGKYNLSVAFDIPTGPGNNLFNWFFVGDAGFNQSSALTQKVESTIWTICNASVNVQYLNISFKNETSLQENITASFATSSFSYYLGSGTVNKTYTFANTPENKNYSFCLVPQNQTVNVGLAIPYFNSVSAQRNYNDFLSLTNSTTQKTKYLLPSIMGQYVTFQVTNAALQAVSGAAITVSSSVFGTIETTSTDSSGSATFFLNPLTSYTVTVVSVLYPTFITTITPTQTTYTISLGGTAANSSIQDYTRGVVYSIKPQTSYLSNGTYYNFNYTISSSFWTLSQYGFTLRNASGSIFGFNSSTNGNGGSVYLNRSTGTNQTLFVDAYWVVNGNYTNITQKYFIFDNTGTDTSLAHLRDRIALYLANGGLFGLTSFGVNILVFLFIFTATGIISYKFGFTSPATVFLTMLVFTWLCDFMNLITYAAQLPAYAASLMVAICTIAFGIREAVS